MKRLSLALSLSTLIACSGSSGTPGPGPNGASLCASTCPKSCATDSDCQTGNGDLCCDFGSSYGKACQAATACPRFCSMDSQCDTTNGQSCCRPLFETTQTVCAMASYPYGTQCLTACSSDAQCQNGQLCETVLVHPVCVPSGQYHPKCSTSSDCKGASQVCCTTISLVNPDVVASGVGACLDVAGGDVCPKACKMSSDCSGATAKLCCNGVCAATCPATCKMDIDCPTSSPICCGSAVLNSPFYYRQ